MVPKILSAQGFVDSPFESFQGPPIGIITIGNKRLHW